MMGKNSVLVVLVVLLIVLGGIYFIFWGGKEKPKIPFLPSTPKPSLTLKLDELGGSKEYGTATLKEESGKLTVILELNGAPGGVSQPAHIHKGACPGVGEVVYPLTNLVNGKSETTINTTLEEMYSQLPLAINVHKSTSEAKVYFSCGNIVKP